MRPFGVLPVLSLLLGARASPGVFDSGKAAPHPVEARDVNTNVCFPGQITGSITSILPLGFIYSTSASGAKCICLSSVPSSIFVALVQYSYQFEAEATTELINDFVNLIGDGDSGCSYPQYSVPTCVTGSVTGCNFECISGYTPSGSSCVSDSP